MSLCHESVAHVKSFHQTCETSKSDHKWPRYTKKRSKTPKIWRTASGSAPIEQSFMNTFFGWNMFWNRPVGIYSQNQNSSKSDNVALSKIFENVKMNEKKNVFFCVFSESVWRIFTKFFFCDFFWDTLLSRFEVWVATTHRLAGMQPLRSKWTLPHWKSNFLLMARVVFTILTTSVFQINYSLPSCFF